MFSVHFTVPSIRKSTELTVVPLGVAVHFAGPVSVAPLAMLDVTTKEDGGGGGGGVAPLATVTALLVVAVRPSAAWALRASVCAPLLSVVVSSVPLASPLNR